MMKRDKARIEAQIVRVETELEKLSALIDKIEPEDLTKADVALLAHLSMC